MDTPFPQKIYIRELISSSKTLAGKKVLEGLKVPSIKIIDLIETVRFNIAYGLAAVLSHRHGDLITAEIEFVKSCLFGTRALIIASLKKFPLTYAEILSYSRELDLSSEYMDLIQHVIDVRNGSKIDEVKLYKNISFLNKVVHDKILSLFEDRGDFVILE